MRWPAGLKILLANNTFADDRIDVRRAIWKMSQSESPDPELREWAERGWREWGEYYPGYTSEDMKELYKQAFGCEPEDLENAP